MAKINATYSSGYYLAPDTDYRKLEEEQQRERKRQRQQELTKSSDKSAIRQTFAMPFNVICLHCNNRIARGTHGYVNRRPTEEKYLGIRIWELEFRCIFCKEHIYLRTDYETAKMTGGYHCSRNCKRGEGDFYGTNQINEAFRAKQANEEADKGTVDALERENEVMQQLQERERLVEELVGSRAEAEEGQTRDELLHVIQAKKKKGRQGEEEEDLGEVDTGDSIDVSTNDEAHQRFAAQLDHWRREETEQQLRHSNVSMKTDVVKVAAVITAKYAAHGDNRQNVFMDGSDSDNDGCVVAPKSLSTSVATPCSATPAPLLSPATCFSSSSSARQKRSVLASLLDD